MGLLQLHLIYTISQGVFVSGSPRFAHGKSVHHPLSHPTPPFGRSFHHLGGLLRHCHMFLFAILQIFILKRIESAVTMCRAVLICLCFFGQTWKSECIVMRMVFRHQPSSARSHMVVRLSPTWTQPVHSSVLLLLTVKHKSHPCR